MAPALGRFHTIEKLASLISFWWKLKYNRPPLSAGCAHGPVPQWMPKTSDGTKPYLSRVLPHTHLPAMKEDSDNKMLRGK